MKDYCSTLEESFTAINRSIMKQDRYFHMLRNLKCSDNKNEPNYEIKIMTSFLKWELHLISSMMCILSIKVNKITVLCKVSNFHSGMCNLTEQCIIINMSCSIKNSLKQFITCACFVTKHNASHMTLIHGIPRDSDPVNEVATSAHHNGLFISQETVHSDTM
jgi:hypothetical protein